MAGGAGSGEPDASAYSPRSSRAPSSVMDLSFNAPGSPTYRSRRNSFAQPLQSASRAKSPDPAAAASDALLQAFLTELNSNGGADRKFRISAQEAAQAVIDRQFPALPGASSSAKFPAPTAHAGLPPSARSMGRSFGSQWGTNSGAQGTGQSAPHSMSNGTPRSGNGHIHWSDIQASARSTQPARRPVPKPQQVGRRAAAAD